MEKNGKPNVFKESAIHYSDVGPEDRGLTRKEKLRHEIDRARKLETEINKNKLSLDNLDKKDQHLYEQKQNFDTFNNGPLLVNFFRDNIKEAGNIAFSLQREKQKEKANLLKIHYSNKVVAVRSMVENFGPFLEFYHRRFVTEAKAGFNKLQANMHKINGLKRNMDILNPAAQVAHEQMIETTKQSNNIEEITKLTQARDALQSDALYDLLDNPELLAQITEVAEEWGDNEGTEDLQLFINNLNELKKNNELPVQYLPKDELQDKMKELQEETQKLWEDDSVRYLAYKSYINGMIKQDAILRETSLEVPSIRKILNQIHSQESRQTKTCVSGVLIGPPGTGKSSVARHYFKTHPRHKDKKSPIAFTMTPETTEYMLFGGEKIDVRDQTAVVQMLENFFSKMDKTQKTQEKEDVLQEGEDLIMAMLMDNPQLQEEANLEQYIIKSDQNISSQTKEFIKQRCQSALTQWKAKEMHKLMYGNDWKMGMILKAVEEGRDLIIDEYNNFENAPDDLRDLLDTPYGGQWTHEKSGKTFTVKSNIILTANEGKGSEHFDYGVNKLTAPLKDRLLPPILMTGVPPKEELMITQAKLSDSQGEFLTKQDVNYELNVINAEDDVKYLVKVNETDMLGHFITKIIPELRQLAKKAKTKDIPAITLRGIDRFCRELVDPDTRVRNNIDIQQAFVKYILKPFWDSPEAWRALVHSDIVTNLYEDGLLHNNTGLVADMVTQAYAAQNNIDLEPGTDEDKRQRMVDVEKLKQTADNNLINHLKELNGNWKNYIKKDKRGNPFVAFINENLSYKNKFNFDTDDEFITTNF